MMPAFATLYVTRTAPAEHLNLSDVVAAVQDCSINEAEVIETLRYMLKFRRVALERSPQRTLR